MRQCRRCASLTDSPGPEDRCGRCADWPDYEPRTATVGDLARLAEHLHQRGGWTKVVTGLIDAMKGADL